MSRVPYSLTAIRSDDDSSGKNIVPYASVNVVDANGNPAQIYFQETGGSPSSSFALNENGFRQIWAEPGQYTITIAGGETYDIFISQITNENFTDAEKTKLAGIQTGATANATDAQLRDRATHTGTQAISTVIGLQSALDSKLDDAQLKTNLSSPDNTSIPSTLAVANAIADSMAGETPMGAWDASTNTPALASSVGTAGYWYEVSVAGTTNLNGETGWQVGDKAIFNGIIWTRIPANAVRSVDGRTGNVILNYDTPAQAALASLPVGAKYSTKGANAAGDGGHGDFIVETASGTPDGYSRVLLANGNHGVLQPVNSTINSRQFGITGGSDETEKVQAMLNFAQSGWTLDIFANDLRIRPVAQQNKSLTLDFHDSLITPLAEGELISLSGSFSDELNVTSLATATVNGVERTVLNVTTTTNYAVGDIIKVVSADEIPTAWTAGRKIGEYSVVIARTEATLTLENILYDHDHFTTQIVCAKLNNYTYTVKNASFVNPGGLVNKGLVVISSARDCTMERIRGNNLRSALVKSVNLFKYRAIDCYAVASESSAPDRLGYVIEDMGSYGGYVENAGGERCRHVFTTNGVTATGDYDLRTGRSIYTRVVGGVGIDCLAGAWDTHSDAARITFVDNEANGCAQFGQSRSPDTTFINPIGDNTAGVKFSSGPSLTANAIKRNRVINPQLTVRTSAFDLYKNSDTPIALTDVSEVEIIGGLITIDNASATRGCLWLSRNVPVQLSIKTNVTVRNQATNPLIFLHASGLNDVSVDSSVVTLASVNSGYAGNNSIVAFDGSAVAMSPNVSVTNLVVRGAGSSILSAVVRGANARVQNIACEAVSGSFSVVDGGGSALPWGYSL